MITLRKLLTVRVRKRSKEAIDDKSRKAVDNAVMTVENLIRDAILPALDKAVVPRVEMAVKPITGSFRFGHNKVV